MTFFSRNHLKTGPSSTEAIFAWKKVYYVIFEKLIQTVMIVHDSFNYHTCLITKLSCTILDYHQLSRSLDKFKFEMIVDDSFFRLSEQIIVNKSFSVSSFTKNGLKQ